MKKLTFSSVHCNQQQFWQIQAHAGFWICYMQGLTKWICRYHMLMYINKAYNNADESLVWSKICLGNKEKESWHDIILLCYTHLRQLFFSLIFFRFSLMSTVYEKNHIFLVVFVWFAWLLSKYKNSFFFVFVTICVANIRLEFRSNHLRCSI